MEGRKGKKVRKKERIREGRKEAKEGRKEGKKGRKEGKNIGRKEGR